VLHHISPRLRNKKREKSRALTSSSNSSGSIFWVGYKGTTYSSDPSVARVRIDLNQPTSIGLVLGGEYFEYLSSANVNDYYQILTDQQALAK
jgi:hypothetical protein